jgi:gliding motility-associated-like protein
VQRYTIVAMDSCFNSGIVNVIHHHTLHTKSVIDRCAQTVSLSWNAYDNWAGGIKEHQIWVGINGSPMQPIDTLSATTFAYVFENAQDNTNYCFAVRAIEEGTNFYSQSNTFCRTLNVVQAMDFIYLANATVLPTTDLVELTWKWATNADLTAWGINQSDNNTNYNRFLVASPMQNPVLTNILSLPNEPINERQIYYKIESIDSCNSSFFSNEVGTIFVKGVANYDFTNTITWTAYENRYGTVTNYQVWRVTAFGEELVTTLNADARSFTEAIDYTVPTQNSLQYYIIAKANINYPDGTTDIIRSRSNTIKISPTLHIQFPNAFRPSGINNTFKPLALFADNTKYLLKIYDRWGGLVFETTDIDTGWDGTKNGKALPQACYFYLINAQQGENGQVFSQNGSVMLLR